jgi:hypothetical protein
MAKTKSSLRINLSAVVYQEGDAWIAHCLELDIVSEGTSRDDALQGLVSLCDFQIKVAMEEGDLRSIFRPAPPEAWQMFVSGRQRMIAEGKAAHGKGGFDMPVERFEARELIPA